MSAIAKFDYGQMADAQLVAGVVNRDMAAAEEVTSRNNQRLFRIAFGILKNRTEAEDAVQSAYLNAFAAMAGFDGRASLSTWLTRIMINEALGRARAAAARNAALDEASVTVIDDYREKLMRGSASAVAPDADLARAQLRSVLERAIALLPDEFRLTFMLREVEELSINEVAELLDIPAATVKTRHLRAKRRLQQALGPEVKTALLGTFPFGGATCAALTAKVLTRFATLPSPLPGE